MRRFLLLTAASLLLGGCNLVVAELPIFTAADTQGAPQLKPGVWLSRDPACEVDTTKPVAEWPACADPSIITADSIAGKGGPESAMPYILAGGDPQVLQMKIQMDPEKPALFMFAGLQVLRSDAQGRIVEARTWGVQCGPPPPAAAEEPEAAEPAGSDDPALGDESALDDAAAEATLPADAEEQDMLAAAGQDAEVAVEEPAAPEPTEAEREKMMEEAVKVAMEASVTREPLPGLTIKDGICLVRTEEPLRNAARESLQWDTEPHTVLYWVKDAE